MGQSPWGGGGGGVTPQMTTGVCATLCDVWFPGQFIDVIGLHAVQFENTCNWMKKIPRTTYLAFRGIFKSNYFQIGQACSPLTY